MPSAALMTYGAIIKPALSLASLSSASGRICDVIDNSAVRAPMAMVWLRFTTGNAPASNSAVRVYLIRHSDDATNPMADQNAEVSLVDAAFSPEPVNADFVGAVTVTNGAGLTYTKSFPVYDLPKKYSFVVFNGTGNTLSSAAESFGFQVQPMFVEAQ